MLRVITKTEVNGVLSEKLTGPQLINKLPTFYGTQGSLPHSQKPATSPYPETDKSSPSPHHTPLRSILILSFSLRLGKGSYYLS
jgi:hypothetical protein